MEEGSFCYDLSQAMPLKPKEFVSGEVFQYLGKNYSLKLPLGVSGGQNQVRVPRDRLQRDYL